MNKKGTQNGIKLFVIGLILVALVCGYYYYLSNRKTDESKKDDVKISAVQEVLMRNLDNNYPPTPREVLKYYGEIAMCLHAGDYTEEEFLKLAEQVQKLYDDELIANKTQQQYLEDLKLDIENLSKQEIVISSYSVSSGADVEEFSQDGCKWARLYCTFNLRKGTRRSSSQELFLLRKDEDGHWKIYGFKLAENKPVQADTAP